VVAKGEQSSHLNTRSIVAASVLHSEQLYIYANTTELGTVL